LTVSLTFQKGKREVGIFIEYGLKQVFPIRSRANTTMGLDFEHMIKARAHKGVVRIGKTPKKLASSCCP
jgi:hypothetical protein